MKRQRKEPERDLAAGKGKHAKPPTQKKKKASKEDYWDGLEGWKPVDVGEDFLLGAEEGGFAGLEVLEDTSIIDPSMLEDGQANRGEAALAEDGPGGGSDAGNGGKASQAEGPEALRARIAALEAELKKDKKQLQQQQQQEGTWTDGEGQPLSKRAAHKLELQKKWQARKEAKQRAKQKKREQQQQQQQQQGGKSESGQAEVVEGTAAPQQAKKAKKEKQKEGKQQEEKQQRQEEGNVDLSAWKAFALHPLLEQALGQLRFGTPTAIQAAVLPAATRDRADIIGAAQTGSGKTLAFGLPIMQHLLQEREVAEATGEAIPHEGKLRALVLTPTRELALQVCSHLTVLGKASQIRVAAIVGGLALVKQERLLRAHPSVVVATPGRLWDLMREGHGHLADLSGLCCLVLDEADRMMQQGHFQELHNILELVPRPGGGSARETTYDPDFQETLQQAEEKEQRQKQGKKQLQKTRGQRVDDDDKEGSLEEVDEDGPGSEDEGGEGEGGSPEESEEDWVSCRGPEGSAKWESEDGEGEDCGSSEEGLDGMESMSGEEFHSLSEEEGEGEEGEDGEGLASEGEEEEGVSSGGDEMGEGGEEGEQGAGQKASKAADPSKKGSSASMQQQQQHAKQAGNKAKATKGGVQTFVFSATLTLPASLRKRLRRGGGGAMGGVGFEKLMDKIPFRGTPSIIDLTGVVGNAKGGERLKVASGVQEARIECLDKEREALLYYILVRHPGRTLVFVNAVSALRRLAALLKLLGLPAHSLHAQQQQRQRLKALDRFRAADNAVLVATDVAARGLDIKDVRCVVHYQLPASADTYIHRSGRTARAGAEGLSVALVAPNEAPRWTALNRTMGREEGQQPPLFPVDLTLMPQVRARLGLAERVDTAERAERKASAEHAWSMRTAESVGIDVSDDDQPASKAPRHADKRKKKGGRVGGADEDDPRVIAQARKVAQQRAAVAGLKAELAQMLSLPLAPRMSKSFFTGGAVGGLNAALHKVGDPSLRSNSSTRGKGSSSSSQGEGSDHKNASSSRVADAGDGAGAAKGHAAGSGGGGEREKGVGGGQKRSRGGDGGDRFSPEPVQGIAEAVAFAARLQQGKDAVKAAQEAKRSAKAAKGAARAAASKASSTPSAPSNQEQARAMSQTAGKQTNALHKNEGGAATQQDGSSGRASVPAAEAAVAKPLGGGGLLKGAQLLRQQLQQQQQQSQQSRGLKESAKEQQKQQQRLLKQQRRKEAAAKRGLQGAMGKQRSGGLAVQGGGVMKAGGGKKKRSSMVVVPPAMGRDTQGPDALEALRRRVALLGGGSK